MDQNGRSIRPSMNTLSEMVHGSELNSSAYGEMITPTEDNYGIGSVITHHKVAPLLRNLSHSARRPLVTTYPQLSNKFHVIDSHSITSTPKLNLSEKIELKTKTKRYLVISTISFVFAVMSYQMFQPMVDTALQSQMELRNGTQLLKSWLKVPIPVYVSFYLFGLSNANAFLRGAKPNVKEYGPFVYKQWRSRNIVQWKSNTVIFTERYNFEYQEDMSASKDVRLTVINYPLFVIMLLTKNMMDKFGLGFIGPVVHNLINVVLSMTGENLIEVRTARELLDGRPIKLMVYVENLLKPLQALGLPINLEKMQSKLPNNSFGFVINRDNIDTGPYENYLRTEHGHLVNEAAKLMGNNKFPNFRPPCNHLGGSDGMFFGTHLDSPYITFYNPQICRTIRFNRNITLFHKGIRAVRYRISEQMFNSSRPENRCYCGRRSITECEGWTDMSGCNEGVPLGISLPHFVYSSRKQREIKGLKPDPQKHVGFMDIEPNIGIPVQASVGMQANLAMDSFFMVPSLSQLRRTALPMMWIGTKAGVEDTNAAFLRIGVYVINYGGYFTLASGLLLSSFFLGKSYREWKDARRVQKV